MNPVNVYLHDTLSGNPAAGVPIRLERPVSGYDWEVLSGGVTDQGGKIPQLVPKNMKLGVGTYRLVFEIEDYFRENGVLSSFPFIQVVFDLTEQVPCLITLHLGATTYSVAVSSQENPG